MLVSEVTQYRGPGGGHHPPPPHSSPPSLCILNQENVMIYVGAEGHAVQRTRWRPPPSSSSLLTTLPMYPKSRECYDIYWCRTSCSSGLSRRTRWRPPTSSSSLLTTLPMYPKSRECYDICWCGRSHSNEGQVEATTLLLLTPHHPPYVSYIKRML